MLPHASNVPVSSLNTSQKQFCLFLKITLRVTFMVMLRLVLCMFCSYKCTGAQRGELVWPRSTARKWWSQDSRQAVWLQRSCFSPPQMCHLRNCISYFNVHKNGLGACWNVGSLDPPVQQVGPGPRMYVLTIFLVIQILSTCRPTTVWVALTCRAMQVSKIE